MTTIDTHSVDRRTFLGNSVTAGLTAALAGGVALESTSARADAPRAGVPVAGAIRRKIGNFEVTALLDGYLDVNSELVTGYDEAQAQDLRAQHFSGQGQVRIPINAYLVNTGDKLILIDAGSANSLGPTAGHLGSPLQAAGVTPEQIDAILITHMHPDHINGVLDREGRKAYTNVELILPETDNAFWFDDANLNAAPEGGKGFFQGARRAANGYKDRQTLFSGETEIVPGLKPLALPGHTPGHTGYVIDSGGETLIIAGDILHLAAYQFDRPDWGIAFDTDGAQAVATRKRFFDQVSSDRVMFAGMHVPFPGFGHLARNGDGYRFVPAEWQYTF